MSEESSTVSTEEQSNYRLPHGTTLQHASKLAIVEDKPIMFDYWTGSLDKEVLIGVRESGEKLLVKSEDEYTSPIAKIYKVESEYIIITENSIYLISADVDTKRIS
jgi:hypothetical protein|tara:strand:- start:157 stop:474 length:318 start_codon:yes stop_codon:yes gene_type:complete